MSNYLPLVIEILSLVLVYAAATVVTLPVRRRLNADQKGIGGIVYHVARPVVILVVSLVLAWSLRYWPATATWIAANPHHVSAWSVFWGGVITLALIEAVAHQVFAWRGRDWPIPDLLEDLMRAVLILLLAFVVLKFELGWDIGPLLASTALLTAVMGFALQGVLGNLLAGMSMHLTRTVRQGDWIAVGDVEGRIKRTNWRETRVATLNGYELIVPNSHLAGAVVHNLNHPTPMRRHAVEVGASYSDEPDEVIAALVEAAREVAEVESSPVPNAIITGFEDYGINYRLRFWTRQFHHRLRINGEVSRYIWYKFKRRGIEIPFPMSDKLLNDFMQVVYSQRKLDADDRDLDAIARDLAESQIDQLVSLDETEYATLARSVQRELWTRGERLMSQGEAGDTFHVLVSGRLEGHIAGDEEITFTVEPGAVLGEMSLLTGEARSATLTAAESCVLLTFDRKAFVALLGLRPEIPERLADLAAERLARNRAAAEEVRQHRAEVTVDRKERAGIMKRLVGFLGRSG